MHTRVIVPTPPPPAGMYTLTHTHIVVCVCGAGHLTRGLIGPSPGPDPFVPLLWTSCTHHHLPFVSPHSLLARSVKLPQPLGSLVCVVCLLDAKRALFCTSQCVSPSLSSPMPFSVNALFLVHTATRLTVRTAQTLGTSCFLPPFTFGRRISYTIPQRGGCLCCISGHRPAAVLVRLARCCVGSLSQLMLPQSR